MEYNESLESCGVDVSRLAALKKKYRRHSSDVDAVFGVQVRIGSVRVTKADLSAPKELHMAFIRGSPWDVPEDVPSLDAPAVTLCSSLARGGGLRAWMGLVWGLVRRRLS